MERSERKSIGRHGAPWAPLLVLTLTGCSDPAEEPAQAFARIRSEYTAPPLSAPAVPVRLVVPLDLASPGGETVRSVAPERKVVILAGEPALLAALGARMEEAFETRMPRRDLRLRPAASRTAVGLALTGQADAALLLGDLSTTERDRGMDQVPVGRWILALYAHPDLPLQHLTRAQVRELFTGRVRQWSQVGGGLGEVQLVLPAPGAAADLAARFLAPGDPLTDGALTAEDPAAVAQLLRRVPGTLGVLPLQVVDGHGLRQVAVEGSRPGVSPGWPFAQKVCLATPGPASDVDAVLAGVLRALLGAE